MQVNHKLGVRCDVLLCKRINGKDIPILPEFKNLILDAFINAVHAGNMNTLYRSSVNTAGIGASFRVGAGSTAPDVTDTALVSPLLLTANCSINSSDATYDAVNDNFIMTQVTRGEFSAAAAEYNLSELAVYTNDIGTNAGNYPILSRTLIKDGLGAPTTLTLAVGEILVIYYTFTCVIPRTVMAVKDIDGTPTTITMTYHASSTSGLSEYPFNVRKGILGALSAHMSARYSDFTPPAPFTPFSTSGWNNLINAISSRTPLGVGVGLKQRDRINLNFSNSPTVFGSFFPTSYGGIDRGWVFHYNPSFEKTDQFVIDIESLTTIARL